jgi:hypothetical protein
MKLGVMQPYFFPYLGYYHLVGSVDHFVFLDDVTYIKGGYINRNTILRDGQPHRFTLPVCAVSSYRAINEHQFSGDFHKFLATLRQAYARAPHFGAAYELIERVTLDPDLNVARKCAHSIIEVFRYLGMEPEVSCASEYGISGIHGQDRIVKICHDLGAASYFNAAGGRELYSPARFAREGLELRFIESEFPTYPQCSRGEFVPRLSMIDILMHCPRQHIRSMLRTYSLQP